MKPKYRNWMITLLAIFHRYLFLLIVFLSLFLGKADVLLYMGIGFVLYAAYSLAGYLLRWKHIYCSYQNLYHQKMTPNNIRWGRTKKSDAYGVPAIFAAAGLLCIFVHFGST